MNDRKILFFMLLTAVLLLIQPGRAIDEKRVPSQDEIMGWVDTICEPESRRPGEPGNLKAENFIFKKFKEFGLKDVRKEPVRITLWRADKWSLAVQSKNGEVVIPSFYVLNTGFTPREGIAADLVYLRKGSVKDFESTEVRGKIAVIDMDYATLPVLPLILLKSYYFYDPDESFLWWDAQPATWVRKNWKPNYWEKGIDITKSAYDLAIKHGALAVVWILMDQPTNINSYYAPYDGIMKKMPALYVGKHDGRKFREMVRDGNVRGTLVLNGTKNPGVMHNVYGVLPGKSRDAILITSHHDSPFKGYTEDGTGMGMVLALAKYFARVPQDEREKTLILMGSAGHFYGSEGIRSWIEVHRDDYVKDIVLNLNMEHIAAREFIEDEKGSFVDTGLMQTRGIFINNNRYYKEAIKEALNNNGLGRTLVVAITALGKEPPGEGRHTHSVGIPIIHYISGPTYLLVNADSRDKVNPKELVPAARTFIEIVEKLAVVSRDDLMKEEEE
jgi:hypothetical protein